MTELNKYRIYCTTESTNVFVWSETTPTVCPNNNTHTIDDDSIVIVESTVNNSEFKYSEVNSTTTPLLANTDFNGEYENLLGFKSINININSDKQSTVDGVELHFSLDGINLYSTKYYTNLYYKLHIKELISTPYFKIIYKNGNEAQTAFKIQTIITKIHKNHDDIKVIEEYIPENEEKTGGNFKAKGYKILCSANSVTQYDMSWDWPITALESFYDVTADNIGDKFDLIIAPNTTIGVITQNATVGDTVLTVNSTVLHNIEVGFLCHLTNGVTMDDLGQVKSIDTTASTITVSNASTNNYVIGNYIQISVHVFENIHLSKDGFLLHIGSSKIGGSYLKKNRIVRLLYTNNNPTEDCYFYYRIEYLY